VQPIQIAFIVLEPSAVSNETDADGVSARAVAAVAPTHNAAAKTTPGSMRIMNVIMSSFLSLIIDLYLTGVDVLHKN